MVTVLVWEIENVSLGSLAMSTESYVGQQFKVNRKSFTVERIIAEGESS